MHYNEYTLPNGLRIIHEPTLSKVAYCGFAIDAGTRDEAEHEQGMAHFVEHLIFKGTEKRKAWHILNRMENVGGDLNAYTNKEETVVYSAFLTEHLERALELHPVEKKKKTLFVGVPLEKSVRYEIQNNQPMNEEQQNFVKKLLEELH